MKETEGIPTVPQGAQRRSLPYSLRHLSQDQAFADAVSLVEVLQEMTFRTDGISDEALPGMTLILNLLRDKIDIGRGVYKFPLNAGSDALALCERGE